MTIFRARLSRYLVLVLSLYLIFCSVAGMFLADGTLHPARRPLTQQEDQDTMRQLALGLNAKLEDVSVTARDGITLRAWAIHPHHDNGDAVILLHGLADNRLGMTGYAQLMLAHGYGVLLPDARAHGASGGDLATYGLRERHDILDWFNWLSSTSHPHCIHGFGESMGAAQLLQSLAVGASFCSVAAESSFASFREIAYDRMGQPFKLGPWLGKTLLRPVVEAAFLRARWKYELNMQTVSPQDAVAASSIPVLLIHGQSDGNIPIRHSRFIHAHNPNTALWEVPNADHCGAITAAPQEFERRVFAWFAVHSAPQE
jgi:uncharacterized protein